MLLPITCVLLMSPLARHAPLVWSAPLKAHTEPELARAAQEDWPRLSPFEAVRWSVCTPEVRFRGTWYGVRKVGGRDIDEILHHCADAYGDRWIKRFEEDLVQVLSQMGSPPGDKLDLVLADLRTSSSVIFLGAELSADNRRAIWQAAKERERTGWRAPAYDAPAERVGVERVSREHASAVAPGYEALARAVELGDMQRLTREMAQADLDQLEWLVEHQFAYRDLKGIDRAAAFDAVRSSLPELCGVGSFAVRVAKLLARFGDGHAGVALVHELLPSSALPCLVEESSAGLLAVRPDRRGFLDPERPRLCAIDGVDVERWIETASAIEADGAPQLRRRRTVRDLRYVAWLRLELGLPKAKEVRLELARLDGSSRHTRSFALAGDRANYGQRIGPDSRRLDGDVGYLRLARMEGDAEFLAELERTFESLRDARALVIDVRGNGGGSRDALRLLLPRFLRDGEAVVANVAAYKLSPGEAAERPDGYLADRFLYPRAWSKWSAAARGAIDELARRFQPEWTPSRGEFSAWHYLVLERPKDAAVPAFTGPLAILQDSDCFSATDVFLAAFAERPNVALVGTPSGGGSGRARSATLAHSALDVRLSSMASFRRDGRRIDGRGIEPDVVALPAPADFAGDGDAMLDAALAWLRERLAR